MQGTRVRALYESDEVLRRLAGTLRDLGADEPSQPTLDENGARSLPVVAVRPAALPAGNHAALLGALRRSREMLEVLDRLLASRNQPDAPVRKGTSDR